MHIYPWTTTGCPDNLEVHDLSGANQFQRSVEIIKLLSGRRRKRNAKKKSGERILEIFRIFTQKKIGWVRGILEPQNMTLDFVIYKNCICRLETQFSVFSDNLRNFYFQNNFC